MSIPIWQVAFYVEGPVSVRRQINTRQQKGFRVNDPFYSDVRIDPHPATGFQVTVTARAVNRDAGRQAAMVFFGQTLDALAFAVNEPMTVSLVERDGASRQPHQVRRIIGQSEIEDSFAEAQLLRSRNPRFLRSLGWYRKGLYTEDSFDAYLALWNSIESVASWYHQYVSTIDRERAKLGSKNQIWACFEALWGECNNWPLIGGCDDWIAMSHDVRNTVAHGLTDITVERVADVASKVPTMRDVAHRFLADWRKKLNELNCHLPHDRQAHETA